MAEGKYQYELFEPLEPEWVEVDVKRVTVERKREFGGAWLGFEMCPSLGLPEFLTEIMKTGREDIPWPVMVLVLVIGRLGDPSSERHLAEHSFAASALGELLGVPADKINEDRLYRALDQLLPHKKKLEKHLKEKLAKVVLPGLRSVALRRQQHVFRRISGGQRSGQTRLLTQTNAPTANRSISPWWSAVAACRSDTNCSRATGTT